MYVTKVNSKGDQDGFDWTHYFINEGSDSLPDLEIKPILKSVRKILAENMLKMSFALNRVMTSLLAEHPPKEAKMLELGAATGFLTRYLLNYYGGTGVLVDNNQSAYQAYQEIKDPSKSRITYLQEDLFQVKLEEKFDIVCSFGLIEHFVEKHDVLEAHKRFVAPDGKLIIIVPLDSALTRVFFEVFPEQNLGYRELLDEDDLHQILRAANLKVLKTEISTGYSYDFIAALCEIA